ncbi:hypothetical protein [Streptomyces sp. CAU 1734]|uniref:hypothetical protein n=1 Tax=Streptomyces sp. CAU 1734 TaxID=3140360 RepID=UPI0032601F3A
MPTPKKISALAAVAVLGLGGLAATAAPATAAPAGPERVRISCTPQNVDGYTGQTQCTNLGTVSGYRVRVTCRRVSNGTLFTIYGAWRVAGWSVAVCSTTGASTVWSVGSDY